MGKGGEVTCEHCAHTIARYDERWLPQVRESGGVRSVAEVPGGSFSSYGPINLFQSDDRLLVKCQQCGELSETDPGVWPDDDLRRAKGI